MAQSSSRVPSAIEAPVKAPQQPVKPAVAKVTLTIRDSTLDHVLRMLAQQSRRQILYNNAIPAFAKRVNVQLVDMGIMEALATVLKGTELIASLAPDKETIVIRTVQDSTNGKRSAVAAGTIAGRVVDSVTKQGIEGATVTIDGTKLADITQQNGAFSLSKVFAGNQLLIVRRSGYVLKSVPTSVDSGKTTTIVVAMRQAPNVLSQVVTTAAGKQYRAEVGNDIARINVDSMLQTAPVRNITDLLAFARIPGIEITPTSGEPGAPSRVRLRGPGSISQSNDPIVVVDGVRLNDIIDRKNPEITRGGKGETGPLVNS